MLAIFGPTASGKSAVAAAVADRIPAEIVSADSMQVYAGLPILTNQPERPTRLVAIWPLDHEGSVGEYQELAHAAIDEILAGGETPVVVGGTGMYLRAALAELDLPPAPRPGARERWELRYDEDGPEAAHAVLAKRDPAAAALVHPNDRRRVVRALELAEAGASLAPKRNRRARRPDRGPRTAHRGAGKRDGRARSRGRGRAGAARTALLDRAQGDRTRRTRHAASRRGGRGDRA